MIDRDGRTCRNNNHFERPTILNALQESSDKQTNKQTNRQTNKQTDATKRIISPASRSIIIFKILGSLVLFTTYLCFTQWQNELAYLGICCLISNMTASLFFDWVNWIASDFNHCPDGCFSRKWTISSSSSESTYIAQGSNAFKWFSLQYTDSIQAFNE